MILASQPEVSTTSPRNNHKVNQGSTVQAAFEDLARRVGERFAHAGYRQGEFADCAARSLEEARLPQRISPEEAINFVLLADGLPEPKLGENDFGYPAVTVVSQERFRIELIFWRDNVAETHHHGAPGAFQLLKGRRLNTEHRFQSISPEPDGIDLGNLHRVRTTLLQVGDILHIPEGEGMLHDLVFLERLCLTISVRATRWEGKVSQNSLYLAPHVRYSPRSLLERRRQALETLTRQGGWQSPAQVRAVLHRSPSHAFALLYSIFDREALFEELAIEAEHAHGDKARLIIRSLRESRRRLPLSASITSVPASQRPELGFAQRLILGLAWIGLDRKESIRVLNRDSGCQPEELLRVGADAVRASSGETLAALSPLLAAEESTSPVPSPH